MWNKYVKFSTLLFTDWLFDALDCDGSCWTCHYACRYSTHSCCTICICLLLSFFLFIRHRRCWLSNERWRLIRMRLSCWLLRLRRRFTVTNTSNALFCFNFSYCLCFDFIFEKYLMKLITVEINRVDVRRIWKTERTFEATSTSYWYVVVNRRNDDNNNDNDM